MLGESKTPLVCSQRFRGDTIRPSDEHIGIRSYVSALDLTVRQTLNLSQGLLKNRSQALKAPVRTSFQVSKL